MSRERILIVEDELAMRTALRDVIEGEGYRVLTAPDGESGLQRAVEEKPDLILLDIMMPRLDGYAVCAALRRRGDAVPILMLTAKGQVEDRITGLDTGADDYLVKPFSTEELLARVRALLRRAAPASPEVLHFADLTLDTGTHQAFRGERPMELTAKEYELLELFLRHPRQEIGRAHV